MLTWHILLLESPYFRFTNLSMKKKVWRLLNDRSARGVLKHFYKWHLALTVKNFFFQDFIGFSNFCLQRATATIQNSPLDGTLELINIACLHGYQQICKKCFCFVLIYMVRFSWFSLKNSSRVYVHVTNVARTVAVRGPERQARKPSLWQQVTIEIPWKDYSASSRCSTTVLGKHSLFFPKPSLQW